MKELSIEQKAKAYDKAAEIINDYYQKIKYSSLSCASNDIEVLERAFPQIKESEDDIIRKVLIDLVKCNERSGYKLLNNIPTSSMITWLEKQRKPNPYSGTSFEYNGHIWGMCARDNGVEIIFDGELKAFLSSEKSFIYPIHPQKCLAPKSAMEAIKEEKVDNANKIEPKDYSSIDPHFFKTTDKAEPKFNVSDWIVCEVTGSVYQIKNCIENLSNHKYGYDLTNGGYICSDEVNHYHLWTIKDAKDGDVLAYNDSRNNVWVCIFKEFANDKVYDYCTLNKESFWEHDNWNYLTFFSYTPATTEQHELLFKKMHEAGYGWDAEKKNLLKV